LFLRTRSLPWDGSTALGSATSGTCIAPCVLLNLKELKKWIELEARFQEVLLNSWSTSL